MAYDGQVATFPLGTGGLLTDTPDTYIPANNLVRAVNCTFYNNVLEKDYGSRRWNSAVVTASAGGNAPIVDMVDFWLDETTQNIVTACAGVITSTDFSLYQFPNAYTANVIADSGAVSGGYLGSYHQFVIGGNEAPGNPRKCIFLSGGSAPRVIDSTAPTTWRVMLHPASDWTGRNQPFGGVIHKGKLFAWGNNNNPHAVYASSSTNHDDFTTSPLNFLVFPGEGERIVGGISNRGVLYIAKYPLGIYQLVDTDTNSANWYFAKFTDTFGGTSPHCFVAIGNDLLVANNYGSFTSLQASLVFGDLTQADLFHQLKIQRFSDDELREDRANRRSVIFYPGKRTLFANFQSHTGPNYDRIVTMDFKDQNQTKVSVSDKDLPNRLALVKNESGALKPFYSSSDGYIYEMDCVDRWVGTSDQTTMTAYTMDAWTAYQDLAGAVNPAQGAQYVLGELNKKFEFAELLYEATGKWDVTMSVYIDGKLSKTHEVEVSGRSSLDYGYALDSPGTEIGGTEPYSKRIPINGTGRRIAFRFQQAVAGQNVRLIAVRLYYQVSGNQALNKGT